MASEDEKRKTLADLVAEYRNDADAMDRGELYQPTTEYLRRLLDRIEAIDSTDAWSSLYSPGNAAAMREALETIHDKVNGHGLDEECGVDPVEVRDLARAALSAPARQCDIGTAEEQYERYMHRCDAQDCCYCPVRKRWDFSRTGSESCQLVWAQMPYEAQEGESNGVQSAS